MVLSAFVAHDRPGRPKAEYKLELDSIRAGKALGLKEGAEVVAGKGPDWSLMLKAERINSPE